MGTSWTAILVAYVAGGVTLIPLVVAVVFLHGYYTFPYRDDVNPFTDHDDDDEYAVRDETSSLLAAAAAEPNNKARSSRDVEVAAGYFAVCREYTPMGINAKPIERSTPLGSTTVASPSPSVYQTMYRSIFDRKPSPAQDSNGLSQRPKKAGNVFYVVLRHGHLMLFDDEEQLEVRHVISLAHHDVSIYSGGDATPEGELFIKRNALRLSRRPGASDQTPAVSKPFYLFSENCSAKEDFYFAMLRNQEQTFGFDTSAPRPKSFDVKSIIALVQRLHASEDHVHSRWLNAILGRLFLAVYKTRDLENFIRDKITNKIARVKRPSFLTNITIQGIDTGEAAPYFTNLKLRDLTVEGECVVEADVRYTGNFRIQVGATVKIDLGARFKARQVNLVLAVVLRRVEGHILFKIKAPPTNRLWTSFQTMPKMEMTIEPIVSSRQITYTVILRQIESRIKEVFAETLVQPFWDDVPFFRTEHKRWRGGIFEGDDAVENSEAAPVDESSCGGVATEDGPDQGPAVIVDDTRPLDIKSQMPVAATATEPQPERAGGFFGRKPSSVKSVPTSSNSPAPVVVDSKPPNSATTSPLRSPVLLKNSTDPIVGTETAHADLFKPSSSPPDHATNYMAALRSRSNDATSTPLMSPTKTKTVEKAPSRSSMQETEGDAGSVRPPGRRDTASSGESSVDAPSAHSASSGKAHGGTGLFQRRETSESSSSANGGETVKRGTLAAVTNAAVQARQWGWNAFQRQKDVRRERSNSKVDLSQPMGRGQPLPPPGVPLPGPTDLGARRAGPMRWAAAAAEKAVEADKEKTPSAGKEKTLEADKEKTLEATQNSEQQLEEPVPPPPPPPQTRRRPGSREEAGDNEQSMLVVEAPEDSSQPGTPLMEGKMEREVADWPRAVVAGGRDESPCSRRPIVALPAKDEEDEEDEEDYSGWMEEDVLDVEVAGDAVQ
ncbi:hypothetical protein L249_8223 [Ophiocordyceps polyrhachis-furcata BCC 54312]|uniref:SMP-LTD domain-containing protein n=1 Tax=Ophiocordyceps polyrhachis-furcata BCC 54312 TaxID=1330021 RepID=A0A367LHM2_9HYPO|nr:hypothetical protein L249_8223 [Ophiocordyceps polyrhachis-furcata BCC 54312]